MISITNASFQIAFVVVTLYSFAQTNWNVSSFTLPSTYTTSSSSQKTPLNSQHNVHYQIALLPMSMSSSSSETEEQVQTSASTSSSSTLPMSNDWELDCYSRPVLVDGKKLWEVLITDATGQFRVCEALPSNRVNSRELRRVIEDAIEDAEVKPNTIRFFRGAMFNMINIALSEVEVVARPSRCTFALASWLEERNRDVYPNMEGYKPSMVGSDGLNTAFLDVRTPVKLPDALRGEKYAFVGLPLAEFLPGGEITQENIGVGRLCPVDPNLPADTFVQGIVILTSRAQALATWLAGTEVAGFKADLRRRTLTMEADISTQYLVAKLDDVQRSEGAMFEEGKAGLGGLHFVSVQRDEDDDPAGFWLMREIPSGL